MHEGLSYPVASGAHFNPQLGVEREYRTFIVGRLMVIWLITESANMLTMLYAHARASGDGSLLSQHVNVKSHVL